MASTKSEYMELAESARELLAWGMAALEFRLLEALSRGSPRSTSSSSAQPRNLRLPMSYQLCAMCCEL